MIAQGAMAFNSLCAAIASPDRIPQILVTLKSFKEALHSIAREPSALIFDRFHDMLSQVLQHLGDHGQGDRRHERHDLPEAEAKHVFLGRYVGKDFVGVPEIGLAVRPKEGQLLWSRLFDEIAGHVSDQLLVTWVGHHCPL